MNVACPHMNFEATVEVNRIGTLDDPITDGMPAHYMANIRITCADCAEPFGWLGLDRGVNYERPMLSVDSTEIRAPIWPLHDQRRPPHGPSGYTFTNKPPTP